MRWLVCFVTIEIRPLLREDDRTEFSCGQADLDNFFQKYAGQNQFKHNIGVTWVAIEEKSILGFMTISAGSMEGNKLQSQNKLPDYPVPILRLARLAVSQRARGRGVGERLLKVAMQIALQLREQVGCVGLVVDAKVDALGFYQRYCFQPLGDVVAGHSPRASITTLFLPIKTIEAAARRAAEAG
jgi:GNAT superfamily N-acetyltransferase